jgi:hypothetical protein
VSTRALIALFVAIVVAGAAVKGALSPPPSTPEGDPRVSAQSTAPRGAGALFLWLDALGRPTRAWRKPLTAIGAEQRALFVLEPTQEVTAAQAAALADWVAAGGTLFLAPGVDAELAALLGDRLALETDPTAPADVRGDRVVPDDGEPWRYREALPSERGLYDYPVDEVAVRGDRRVRDLEGEGSVLFARDGLGLAAEMFHGDGVIVLFPEADPLTNRGLAKGHNAELVASLVEDWVPPGTEIWFDEYDHGARVAGSLAGYLARRRPGLFAVALAAAGLLAVQRWGRALVVRAEPARRRRRDPTEFVEALGALYARSRAVGPAWSALAGAARRLAEGGLAGVAARGDPDELRRALAATGRSPEEKDLVRLAQVVARRIASGKERG